jgi:hypothetical protein
MQFYDTKQLYKKLQKPYERGDIFRAFMQNEELFPLEIPLKKVQQKDIQTHYTLLTKELKLLQETKLPLLYAEYSFKTLGKQTLPWCIRVVCLDEYLSLIHKEQEYADFTKLYTQIVVKYPLLKELFIKKPALVLEYAYEWDKLFLIVEYFLSQKQKNHYIREIGLEGIDTKYIQKHKKIIDILLSCLEKTQPLSSLREYAFEKKYSLKYPLPQVRFRILDRSLYIAGLSDITLTIEEFERLDIACENVFIVENQITTLAFPDMYKSIVIFGSGYKVGVLKNVKWLWQKKLFYWGDIDSDGFAILSQIRGYFPSIASLCMDFQTLQRYSEYVVEDTTASFKELRNLTQEEQKLYTSLHNKRLEQERIPFKWFLSKSNNIDIVRYS